MNAKSKLVGDRVGFQGLGFPVTVPAIEPAKRCIFLHFAANPSDRPRKAKAVELFRIQRLSLVAGVGFEPTTFRL